MSDPDGTIRAMHGPAGGAAVAALTLLCAAWSPDALAQEAEPIPCPNGDPAYRLVWREEFDGDGGLDPSRWMHEVGFVRNRELQWYRPANAFREDGVLVVEARRETVRNPRFRPGARGRDAWRRTRREATYTSACVKTRGRRSWRYGVFEIRARIPCEPGLWPAAWTLGTTFGSPRGWPGCGEIDVMEWFGGDLLANAAWADAEGRPVWDDSRTPTASLADGGGRWDADFHVWRMDWTPDRIELSVDGRVLQTIDLARTTNGTEDGRNPFHEPHHLLLNLAVGGTRGGDPSGTEFPTRYEIDHVRIWQRPEHRMPRVLVLGDSISMGYTPHVRALLASEAEVVRPILDGDRRENCEGTTKGVEAIDRWLALGGGGDWDVVHVNFGLHDLKRVDPGTRRNSDDPSHPRQAEPDVYERQLRRILSRIAATGAEVVVATTTPVPEGGVRPHRDRADPPRYNEILVRVGREVADAEVDDLYRAVVDGPEGLMREANVHFTPAGRRFLAGHVATAIRRAIERRRTR